MGLIESLIVGLFIRENIPTLEAPNQNQPFFILKTALNQLPGIPVQLNGLFNVLKSLEPNRTACHKTTCLPASHFQTLQP